MADQLANDHAETVCRYRIHCAFLGIAPVLAPNPYPRRVVTTPNQVALWIADEYSRSPAAAPLVHAWLDDQDEAFMGSEQGGYRGFWPEAVLSMVQSAERWKDKRLLDRLVGWLGAYCAYAALCDPGDGASRIPGTRLGSAFGRDGNRDKVRAILAGRSVRVGEFSPLDSDACVKMAAALGAVIAYHPQADLPRLLSSLTVELYSDGMRAYVQRFEGRVSGGPVWSVAADRHGREAMVSWRDVVGSDDWAKAKRWGGRTRDAPLPPVGPWQSMGRLVEVWRLDRNGARRLDSSEPAAPPPPPVKPPPVKPPVEPPPKPEEPGGWRIGIGWVLERVEERQPLRLRGGDSGTGTLDLRSVERGEPSRTVEVEATPGQPLVAPGIGPGRHLLDVLEDGRTVTLVIESQRDGRLIFIREDTRRAR